VETTAGKAVADYYYFGSVHDAFSLYRWNPGEGG